MILFILSVIAVAGSSCESGKIKKTENKESVIQTALDIDERLIKADSLVLVFYKDPYGADSLRYTRFYTQISTTDAEDIELLQKQLAQKTEKQEKYRKCRGEGKIWCYSKGKIFQTLYFSTRCNDCCHVYLIKDGFFYYVPILKSFTSWLISIEPLAKEP
jgi:hypothetical protein